ncbi:MAG: response regulator [Myxococcales bacterium]|nr:response regulator [Myxococcales bacterium]
MEMVTQAILVSWTTTLIAALIYCYLYFVYRERFIGFFAAFWVLYTVKLAFDLTIELTAPNFFFLAINHLSVIFMGYAALETINAYARLKTWRPVYYFAFPMVVWILFTSRYHPTVTLLTWPAYLYCAGIFLYTSVIFFRQKDYSAFLKPVTAVVFFTWGGVQLAYPFIRSDMTGSVFGYSAASVIKLFVALSVLLVYFEKIRKDLTDSDTRLRQIINLVPHHIYAKDLQGKFILANEAVARTFDVPLAELTGKTEAEFRRGEIEPKTLRQDDHEILQSGKAEAVAEEVVLDAKGKTHYFQTTKIPYTALNSDQPAVLSVAIDITDRKQAEKENARLQDQLQQAQKLEAVGQLAGGIAHDFNNLLTGIAGNVELSLMEIEPEHPLAPALLDIKHASERAEALTRQLLAFSRKQLIQPRLVNLNQILDNLAKMLGRVIGENIELKMIREPKLQAIKADPSQLEQVLLNLVINARDAMPEGGRLIIETANRRLNGQHLKNFPQARPGNYVQLSVTDNGIGMDEAVQKHIFEPFFTTKPKGKGTGLGLSTVYGATRQNGGLIDFVSAPGKGTTFFLYFPQADETEDPLAMPPVKKNLPTGTETILLAEDDPLVLDMTLKIIKHLGYRVHYARNGAEALALGEKYGSSIQLLMTDVIMPLMNGKELAERLTKAFPHIKVLFTSGYTDDVIGHHGILEDGINFLPKPFTPRLLAQKLREELDS